MDCVVEKVPQQCLLNGEPFLLSVVQSTPSTDEGVFANTADVLFFHSPKRVVHNENIGREKVHLLGFQNLANDYSAS